MCSDKHNTTTTKIFFNLLIYTHITLSVSFFYLLTIYFQWVEVFTPALNVIYNSKPHVLNFGSVDTA